MFNYQPLLALNPSAFNSQVPVIPKSDGLIKMYHLPTFQQPLEVLESKHRPIKRQKVTSKVKKADENCLSAAAIVVPISLSTNKDTSDLSLTTQPKLSCECGTSFTQKFNLNKHRKTCQVHGMHGQLSDLVDQLNQMNTNIPSGQIAQRLSEVFKLQQNTLHQPTISNNGLEWQLDVNLDLESTLNASKSTKITLGTSDLPIKEAQGPLAANGSIKHYLQYEQNLTECLIKDPLNKLNHDHVLHNSNQEEARKPLLNIPDIMYRDLSLPKLPQLDIKRDHMLAKADDLRGSNNQDFNICRPTTLRHSWFKAVAHHYTDPNQVHLKLHELRIKELKLTIEQDIDHAVFLSGYLVPLQAMLDLVLDDESSFDFNLTNARDHKCEGKIKNQARPWSTVVFRPCNKLCYLTESARRKVLDIEAQISEVIALQAQLIRRVETMEREGELAMATGSLTTRWSYPMAEVVEQDLQHARDRKEEDKVGRSTVADSSKKLDLQPKRREQLLKQPQKPARVERPQHEHIDRSDWVPVPDFTNPETLRPDEQENHTLKKWQLELLNKLYHLQFKRDLDSFFVDGGYLSKPLNEVQVVLKEAMDGKDEVMEQHLPSMKRDLYLNNTQPEVQVSSDVYQKRTLDILLEVKQTRVCIKKVQDLFDDLDQSQEVSESLMGVIDIMIADWQELVKYHRKRTLTSLLNYDLSLSGKLMKGKYTYRMIVETQFPALVRIENDGFNDNEIGVPHQKVSVKDEALTMKDLQVTIDSETHSQDKVELSHQASQFYHDTIRTLHLVKECTERLQEMFADMSSIIKQQHQSRRDLVKPFEVVCDKFLVSYDEEFPLSNKTKQRSKSYQRYSKVLTTSNSNSYRQSRLECQLNLIKGAISNFKMMMNTRKVTRLQVRDLASFSGFERVEKLVKQERVLRHTRRHYKTIAKTLGEQYLKKKQLNKSAYVCINEDYAIDGYIEGLSELPSPPLSAKPSAVKLSKAYTFTDLGKRSCKQQPSSDQGLVDPQLIQVKPLTASKKQVSFMASLDGADVARLNHCREFQRQQDDTDFLEAFDLRDRITIGFWGSIEKYNEWKAHKQGRSKSALIPGDQHLVQEQEIKVSTKQDRPTFKVDNPQNTKGSKNMIRDSLSKSDSGQRQLLDDASINTTTNQGLLKVQEVPTGTIEAEGAKTSRQQLMELGLKRQLEGQRQQ